MMGNRQMATVRIIASQNRPDPNTLIAIPTNWIDPGARLNIPGEYMVKLNMK